MSRTSEIITNIESLGSDLDSVKTTASGARERADDLAGEATAHGWDGLATAMQSAVDALDTAVGSLDSGADAVGEAIGALREISDQMSAPDVQARHQTAVERLNRARVALDAAASSVEDAHAACEQAGSPDQLATMIQTLTDDTETLRGELATATDLINAEQQQVTAWVGWPRHIAMPGPPQNRACDFHRTRLKQAPRASGLVGVLGRCPGRVAVVGSWRG